MYDTQEGSPVFLAKEVVLKISIPRIQAATQASIAIFESAHSQFSHTHFGKSQDAKLDLKPQTHKKFDNRFEWSWIEMLLVEIEAFSEQTHWQQQPLKNLCLNNLYRVTPFHWIERNFVRTQQRPVRTESRAFPSVVDVIGSILSWFATVSALFYFWECPLPWGGAENQPSRCEQRVGVRCLGPLWR